MKIHEKAKLYDSLLKDYTQLIEDMQKFQKDLEALPEREDMLELKNDPEKNWMYNPSLLGSYKAAPFGLSLKVAKHESNLKWYQNQ